MVRDSAFTTTSATYAGGAICNDGYNGNASLTIERSAFKLVSATYSGGAIYNDGQSGSASVIMSNSSVSNATAGDAGGAIYNLGYAGNASLSLIGSTIANSNATNYGGAIYNDGRSGIVSLSMMQSTIALNSSTAGGGIYDWASAGQLTAINTIVANNTALQGDGNVNGTIDNSHNSLYSSNVTITLNTGSILNANPLLAPLANYGGNTLSMPPLPGNPAIGAGTPGANVPSTDQRGFVRVGSVDIGSVQTQGFSVSNITGSGQSATVNSNFTNPLAFEVRAVNGIDPVAGGVISFNMPQTGASGSFVGGVNQATISANGVVSTDVFKANTVAGNYLVAASASGLTPVQFPLTNLAGAAAIINIDSGNNQSSFMAQSFTSPLVVRVTDTYGNPVSGTTVTFAVPGSGASASFAGGLNTASSNASGIATSAGLTANNYGGNYNVTASAAGLTSLNFSLSNVAPNVSGMVVQKGSVGRSFVRYVDLAFNTTATLNDIVASIGTGSPRIRMTNTGLDGNSNVNYSLAGKIAAVDAVLAMDFGLQGIGGDRNAATGDGSYLIEMDLDGNGSFETSRRFFRLLGDVNGDKVVDTLEANLVTQNIGATGANGASDINGDGVVNAADTLLVRRQKGRKITI